MHPVLKLLDTCVRRWDEGGRGWALPMTVEVGRLTEPPFDIPVTVVET